MISPGLLSGLALAWMLTLFVIALSGDKWSRTPQWSRWHPYVYTLSIGVYCTTWTFYGSVGQLAETGWYFPPTYLGAILLFLFGGFVLAKLIRVCKEQNLSSIADVLSARFGRSSLIAGTVTFIALIGIIPYIALQLKALTFSFDLLTQHHDHHIWWRDTALLVTAVMIGFTILFGARHTATSEQQPGLMVAIAFESVFKLIALLTVAVYAMQLDVPSTPLPTPRDSPQASGVAYLTQALLGVFAMLALPRQFHVTVVEHSNAEDTRKARWGVPIYLLILGVALLPLIQAGNALFGQQMPADTYVLNVPLATGSPFFAVVAFIGGLAAATSMIIVASIALSTMVSHSFFVPMLLRLPATKQPLPFNSLLLWLRRFLIAGILLSAYFYYKSVVAEQKLAAIGLVSFVAVAQFMPALLAALFWSRAHRRGAVAGLVVGSMLWFWTLVMPDFASAGWMPPQWVNDGLFGIAWLKPQAMFGLQDWDVITHGALISLSGNTLCFVVLSLFSTQTLQERLLTKRFVGKSAETSLWPTTTTLPVSELIKIVARFYGEHSARARFYQEAQARQLDSLDMRADQRWLDFTLREITGVVGAASARSVLHVALRRSHASDDVETLVDEASHILQFNQALLSTTLNTLEQGVIVIDRQLKVVAWNPRYVQLFKLPEHFLFIGRPIADVLRFNANHVQQVDDVDLFIARRLAHLQMGKPHHTERQLHDGRVLEIHGVPMPGGGYVTSYTDISEHKHIQRELQTSNERLELRVAERTAELAATNTALSQAKWQAETANAGKTRFLAAASHDLVQPLNAAQLFADALHAHVNDDDGRRLLQQLNESLQTNEELLKCLLDISKLDAGVIKAEIVAVPLARLLRQLNDEFAPLAQKAGLLLQISDRDVSVKADAAMLRRLLQNLISNALRYTDAGSVRVDLDVHGGDIEISVSDTGIGIAPEHQQWIFEEFRRTPAGSQRVPGGHGLGLAIVQRLARAMNSEVLLQSTLGTGSRFSLRLPIAEHTANETTTRTIHGNTPLSNKTILCLDNDPAMLAGLDAVLKSWQCQTTLTRDRTEFSRADIHAHDAIVADYQLDDGDTGLDLWLQLPEPRPPLVLISAVRDKSLIQLVQEHGAHYLAKPVKPLALRSVLQTVLQRQAFEHD